MHGAFQHNLLSTPKLQNLTLRLMVLEPSQSQPLHSGTSCQTALGTLPHSIRLNQDLKHFYSSKRFYNHIYNLNVLYFHVKFYILCIILMFYIFTLYILYIFIEYFDIFLCKAPLNFKEKAL